MKTTHNQIKLRIHGRTVKVDEGIVDLIRLINSLPEFQTEYSCQGGEGYDPHAYVKLTGVGVVSTLPELAMEIFKEQNKWSTKHHHVCNGCKSMSISLEIDCTGIGLRWMPWDYQRLLHLFKRIKNGFDAGTIFAELEPEPETDFSGN